MSPYDCDVAQTYRWSCRRPSADRCRLYGNQSLCAETKYLVCHGALFVLTYNAFCARFFNTWQISQTQWSSHVSFGQILCFYVPRLSNLGQLMTTSFLFASPALSNQCLPQPSWWHLKTWTSGHSWLSEVRRGENKQPIFKYKIVTRKSRARPVQFVTCCGIKRTDQFFFVEWR